MFLKELKTAISHIRQDKPQVSEANVILCEDYFGYSLLQLETQLKELLELLVKMKDAKDKAIARGNAHFFATASQFSRSCYEDLIENALADNPVEPRRPKSRGRNKQCKARNLLERFRDYLEDVLRFFYDFKVPFDNNPSECDLRKGKAKQKISGCFRSLEGVMCFARIHSYITTARKQNVNAFYAHRDLFEGRTLALQLVGV